MRKLIAIFAVGLLTLGSASLALAVNLLQNPGFENWTINGAGGPPDNWSLVGGFITASREAVQIHGGLYSAKCYWTSTNNQDMEQAGIPVSANTSYNVKYWCYDNDPKGRSRAGIYWYDSGGAGAGSYWENTYTVDSPSWQQWSCTVTSPANAATAKMVIRFYDVGTPWTSATNYVDDALFESAVIPEPDTVTIYEIQHNETTPGTGSDCYPSPLKGQMIWTRGIVTAVLPGTYKDFWIQDAEAPWSGVFVYDNTILPQVGDDVRLKCSVDEYYGLTELKNVAAYTILSHGNPLPNPLVIHTSDIGWEDSCFVGGEAYEGVLVRVNDPWCTKDLDGTYNEWYICDNTAEAQVDDDIYFYDPWTGEHFEFIIGIVDYSYSIFELLPRGASDLGNPLAVELSSFEAIAGDNHVTLTWRTAAEVNTQAFNIYRDGQIIATVDAFGDAHDYVYVDRQVANGTTYTYQLSDVDLDGSETMHQMICSVTPNAVPTDYALAQNYPNPFNPSTEIRYSIPARTHVTLNVYNLLGQEIATLVDEVKESGQHTISWNAADNASGVYFYRLQTDNFSATKKMVYMK